MDARPLLFWDSGAGGLPYCRHFLLRNPAEPLVYLADRSRFPYGPKSRAGLIALLDPLVRTLLEDWKPKLAVLACNTLSVSALGYFRRSFPEIPWVGTVPAVKPAVEASLKRHIGVLGTERTVEDPYIAELAARFGPDCRVTALAAPELVDFAERSSAHQDSAESLHRVRPYVEQFRRAGADAIVLGCTHFLLLLDAFKAAALPDITVYDSVEGVTLRAEALLDREGLRAAPGGNLVSARDTGSGGNTISAEPLRLLLLTGPEPASEGWRERAACFGLSIRLIRA
jgi:glutamate racemase